MAGGKGRGRDQFLAATQKGNPNPYISVENAPLFANNRVLYCSRVTVQAENVIIGIISYALITMILRKPAGCVKNAVTIYESHKIVATLSVLAINVKFNPVKIIHSSFYSKSCKSPLWNSTLERNEQVISQNYQRYIYC